MTVTNQLYCVCIAFSYETIQIVFVKAPCAFTAAKSVLISKLGNLYAEAEIKFEGDPAFNLIESFYSLEQVRDWFYRYQDGQLEVKLVPNELIS